MRKHIARTCTVLAVAAATLAPSPAYANHGCVGFEEIPESYVCYVRFAVEVPTWYVEWHAVVDEPGQSHLVPTSSIYFPGQTFTIGSQPVEVESESQNVPRFCATTLLCVESFDVTTPHISGATPEIESNTLPVQPLPDDILVETDPVYVEAPSPVIVMPDNSLLVLYYMGQCHYVWPDGDVTSVNHTGDPDFCP